MSVLARSVLVPIGSVWSWVRSHVDFATLLASGEAPRPEAPHPWAAQLPYFAEDRD